MLDELTEIDPLPTECALDRRDVCRKRIGRKLHALRKAAMQIMHERVGVLCRALSNEPRHNELGIGIERGKRPNVPIARTLRMALLCPDERPYLVRLDAPTR